MPDKTEEIKTQVDKILDLQKRFKDYELEITSDPKFKDYLDKQKKVSKEIADFWKTLEKQMIDNDVKSIKSEEWGSITIAERTGWDIDESLLPAKFYQKTIDKKKITDTFKLEGKEPKGCSVKYTKYLTKRLK